MISTYLERKIDEGHRKDHFYVGWGAEWSFWSSHKVKNSIQLQCLSANHCFVVESCLFLQLRFSFLFQCICPWNVQFFRHVQKKTRADCSTLHTPQDWNRRTSSRITTLRVQKGQPTVLTLFPQTLSSWSAGHWNSREDLNWLWHLMVCWLISRDHSHPAFKPWA